MANASEPPPYTPSLRLLALDGGGVRGLSELLILKRLMHRIRAPGKNEKLPKPCEYFDIICGTSTGGLIAIMLGRLEMDIDECINIFVELSKEIFPKDLVKKGWWKSTLKLANAYQGKSWFSADALESCLKKTISNQLGQSEVDQEFLTESTKCKVLVSVTRAANAGEAFLRSYQSQMEPPISCTIWQAGRATSAAPLYFDPISVGALGSIYADGGMRNNNPVWALFDEVRTEWPHHEISCLVSIGTGKPETIEIGSALQEVFESCVAIATETEVTARRFLRDHRTMAKEGRYFRFNVEQGMQGIGLEEWKYTDRMDAATQEYLNDHHEELGVCSARLARSI